MGTVHLFVFDSFADWEASFAVAGINDYQMFQTRPGTFSVRTVGLTKSPVKTMGGITVLPDIALADLAAPQSALLILPGGTAWDENRNHKAIDKAAEFLEAGVPVAAICGATAGLARAGILDARPHTSNARDYLRSTGYRGADFYRESPCVTNGNLITAAGTAPVDFARAIFERLGIYRADVLDAWYGLFKTGEASYYDALLKAIGAP